MPERQGQHQPSLTGQWGLKATTEQSDLTSPQTRAEEVWGVTKQPARRGWEAVSGTQRLPVMQSSRKHDPRWETVTWSCLRCWTPWKGNRSYCKLYSMSKMFQLAVCQRSQAMFGRQRLNFWGRELKCLRWKLHWMGSKTDQILKKRLMNSEAQQQKLVDKPTRASVIWRASQQTEPPDGRPGERKGGGDRNHTGTAG